MRRTVAVRVALSLGAGLALVGCGSEPAHDWPEWGEVHYVAWGTSRSTVTVAWAAIDGAVSYTIERGSSEDDLVAIATVPATRSSYLDRGLEPETEYTYRFTSTTATGSVTEPVLWATTTDQEILTTGELTAVGAPVEASVGPEGATIEVAAMNAKLVIPPDTVPDATAVMIQPIASPYPDDDSPGVTVESSVPFARPVELVFGFDELDALAPDHLTIAVQAADGAWLAQPRIVDADAGTVTLVMDPESATFGSTWARPGRFSAARLRTIVLTPRSSTVSVRQRIQIWPYGLFSDNPCLLSNERERLACVATVGVGMLSGVLNPRNAVRPANPEGRPLLNAAEGFERAWTVEHVLGGSNVVGRIVVNGSFGAFYTAPAAVPPGGAVAVRFHSVTLPDRVITDTAPAIVRIMGPPSLRVTGTFRWDGTSVVCPAGSVDLDDTIGFSITTEADGNFRVDAIANQPTTVSNLVLPSGLTGEITQEPEVFTATYGTVTYEPGPHLYTILLEGDSVAGGCVITDESGASFPLAGSPLSTLLSITVREDDLYVIENEPYWDFAVERVE
jgi:hypothetical protein